MPPTECQCRQGSARNPTGRSMQRQQPRCRRTPPLLQRCVDIISRKIGKSVREEKKRKGRRLRCADTRICWRCRWSGYRKRCLRVNKIVSNKYEIKINMERYRKEKVNWHKRTPEQHRRRLVGLGALEQPSRSLHYRLHSTVRRPSFLLLQRLLPCSQKWQSVVLKNVKMALPASVALGPAAAAAEGAVAMQRPLQAVTPPPLPPAAAPRKMHP